MTDSSESSELSSVDTDASESDGTMSPYCSNGDDATTGGRGCIRGAPGRGYTSGDRGRTRGGCGRTRGGRGRTRGGHERTRGGRGCTRGGHGFARGGRGCTSGGNGRGIGHGRGGRRDVSLVLASLPSNANCISKQDSSFSLPVSNEFLPIRDPGRHLPDNLCFCIIIVSALL